MSLRDEGQVEETGLKEEAASGEVVPEEAALKEEAASGEVVPEEAALKEEAAWGEEVVLEEAASGMAKSGVLKVTLLSDASESVSNTVFMV